MCRWLAYTGSRVLLERALYAPAHSVIDQSLHSKLGAEATNGDGFGIGWYDEMPTPGVFRSVEPAWNDQNLRELAGHIHSGHFFAHIRAAIGSAVQQTNCHPFRRGRWLFMHNGFLADFATIKRDLVLAVDESLYPQIAGQADTEVLFYLALTFGFGTRAIGLIETIGERKGIRYPFQGTSATTDGERLRVFRYSSEGKSRSLFSPSTFRRSASSIRSGRSCTRSPTTRGWRFLSRWATYRARGTRYPRRTMGWSAEGKINSAASRRSRPRQSSRSAAEI